MTSYELRTAAEAHDAAAAAKINREHLARCATWGAAGVARSSEIRDRSYRMVLANELTAANF